MAAHVRSLGGGFVWDDRVLILRDPAITSLANAGRVATRDFLEAREGDLGYGYWRPAVTWTYMLDWQLWRYDPFGYRLTNLVLHGMCSLIGAGALLLLLGDRRVAFAGGVVFAVHPIHVESVAWIAGRTDLLAGLLGTAALLAWLAARRELLPVGTSGGAPRRPGHQAALLACSALLYAAALLAKEVAVVVPIWIAVISFARRPPRRRAALTDLALFALVTAGYLAARLAVGVPPPGQPEEHGLAAALLSAGPTVLRYLGWLVAPLTAQPFAINPYVEGLLDLRLLVAGSVVLAAIVLVRRFRPPTSVVVLSAMTLLAFVPVLNLVRVAAPMDMGNPMAERFCYLPSLPFAGLVGLAAARIWGRMRAPAFRVASAGAALVLIGAAIFACHQRAELWSDHLGLVAFMHRQAPEATLPAVLYAEALSENGQITRAGELLDRLERQTPEDATLIAARATWLVLQRRWPEALEQQVHLVRRVSRSLPIAESNLAFLLLRTGALAEADAVLSELVQDSPWLAEAWYNLGDLRRRQGRVDAARSAFRTARELAPADSRFAAAHAGLELADGRPTEAAVIYQQLLAVRGPEPGVLNNLAASRAQAGQTEAAIADLRWALRLDPDYLQARLNLARILTGAGRDAEARLELEHVLARAAPDSPEARMARDALGSARRPSSPGAAP